MHPQVGKATAVQQASNPASRRSTSARITGGGPGGGVGGGGGMSGGGAPPTASSGIPLKLDIGNNQVIEVLVRPK